MNLLRRCRGTAAVAQLSLNQAAVSSPHLSSPQALISSYDLKGLDVWDCRLLVWRSDSADVYELCPAGANHVASFPLTEESFLAIHRNFIFQTDDESVKILNFQGGLQQILPLYEFQGQAFCLDVSQDFLVLSTDRCYIRMWRIDGADIKPYGPSSGRKVICDVEGQEEVTFVRCNSDGSKISLQVKSTFHTGNKTRIYVYDTVMDKVISYDFRDVNQELISNCWDGREPRLLACETIHGGENTSKQEEAFASLVSIFFVTADDGFLRLEEVALEPNSGLLGVDIPYIHFFSSQLSEKNLSSSFIKSRTMKNFVGLEKVGLKTTTALIDFNYNLAKGNLDDAYNALQDVSDKGIWRSLACICVKTKRVDVALHCFARMGLPSASESVLDYYIELEEDASIAAVAVQLELLDEAKQCYIGCKRYDLLNQLHQICGDWEKAIEVASEHDRVHLNGTLHAYARHLETLGNMTGAIHHYELSGTHRSEVPRMLYAMQRMEDLQSYVDKSGDPVLHQWWGHYCEGRGQLLEAIKYYTAAGDTLSLVQVYCFQKDFSTAASLVLESSDLGAAFDLAQQYEKSGQVCQAIRFFSKAGKSDYAARLSMKNHIDNELLSLSLQSSKGTMLAAAKYYEGKNKHEEAVLLFHKGGELEKAINICFRAELFDALKAIAEDLSEDADPLLLTKCGDFLMQHKQFDKAVQLYIAAKNYEAALNLCTSQGVMLTDKMADAMTPKSEARMTQKSTDILCQLAVVFTAQGSYHLACKRYTQAGDKLSAMKALLKSGDTERIMMFANLSRQKQMYVMAANYLQSLDWHHDANIMKTIIQMYGKAGEMESLASFYEACAQIEIDEFRDYDKALGAMREALKYLFKATSVKKDAKIQFLEHRIAEVERFVQIRRMAKADPTGMFRSCNELLVDISCRPKNSQAAVRVGDLYALMIEFYHSQGSMEHACQLIEKMRSSKIALGPYIEPRVIRMVYQAIGVEVGEDSLDETISEDMNEFGAEALFQWSWVVARHLASSMSRTIVSSATCHPCSGPWRAEVLIYAREFKFAIKIWATSSSVDGRPRCRGQ